MSTESFQAHPLLYIVRVFNSGRHESLYLVSGLNVVTFFINPTTGQKAGQSETKTLTHESFRVHSVTVGSHR